MGKPKTALLGYALLGLLYQKPSSGYDVRKIFTSTALGSFSDSPGAIYPALQRLESSGLIRGQIQSGPGLRRKKVFRLTAAGTRELMKWLTRPITNEDILRSLSELMLRFSFIEGAIGPAEAVRFLKAMQHELKTYVPSLQQYLDANKTKFSLSMSLALECGIRGNQSLADWTTYAIKSYEEKK